MHSAIDNDAVDSMRVYVLARFSRGDCTCSRQRFQNQGGQAILNHGLHICKAGGD